MDLDEIIFSKFVKYFSSRKKDKEAADKNVVWLEQIKPKLLIMARAFSGYPIEIYPALNEGGYKDNNFFLPASVNYFSESKNNFLFFVFRIVYMAVQKKLKHHWTEMDNNREDIEASREMSKEKSTEVLQYFQDNYINVYELYIELRKSIKNDIKEDWDVLFFGKWMVSSPEDDIQSKNFEPYHKNDTKTVDPKTIITARAIEEIKSLQVDIKAQEDYVLTHNFEKVETAEEFSGTWRDFDGEDDLKEHHDAINELHMKWTVRVNDPVHSVLQSEFMENTTLTETADVKVQKEAILYPEWNYKKRNYKENFVKVFPAISTTDHSSYYHKTIEKHHLVLLHIRKMLASYHNRLLSLKRQKDGQDLDIDALIDMYTDIHSGKTPQENLYINRMKKSKELGILLLIDASLSSDSYADGNRIIDVAKEVSILFGEVLDEFQIDFSIAAFHSQSRNYIQFTLLKDFRSSWQMAKNYIGTIEPAGYTRIGGALRHSISEFKKSDAKNKWLILLSDGKPNDYDTYEGRYGIEDVKQSLYELNSVGINSYAFAIEANAKYYLPQMFGQNHYQILSSPNQLIHSLIKLFEKIKNK